MSSSPPTVDRISALPDELLCHILSFLQTKQAFTTTVLSKRWTPLYRSLTDLYFDDEGVQDKHAGLRFRRYVDTFLLFKHHPIRTLRLISRSKCRNGYSRLFNLNKWLIAAILRRIENLELSIARSTPLPPRVLTSQTLVVLKLKGFDLRLSDTALVHLPSLKTLHLEKSHFKKRDNLMMLLSGCPNLVDLFASAVFYGEEHGESSTGYEFTLPKLEKACICALSLLPFTVISNVKFLQIINTGYLGISERMPMFRNLINTKLCFGTFRGWHDVQKLLPYCPKLQTLVIQKLYRHNYTKKCDHIEPVPECVSFHLRTCSITSYRDTHEDFEFVAYIMENARLLQVMKLHSALNMEESKKDELFKHLSQCSRISPRCKIILDTKEVH